METNKRVLDNCGKCLFCYEMRDMGASWYACELPVGMSESVIMCNKFAGNCPYFLSKDVVNELKKSFIEKFKKDNVQNQLLRQNPDFTNR